MTVRKQSRAAENADPHELNNPVPRVLLGLVAALCIGLVIGLERGWRHREAAEGGRVAGLRTFALTMPLSISLASAGSPRSSPRLTMMLPSVSRMSSAVVRA